MNNMNTNTTFALRLGIAMLMIFVWAMPLLATSLPTPDGFRSTSPYKLEATGLEATYQGNKNFGNKTYTSTIYDPFGNQTPSSGGGGNPANNDGNGSGEDVGIPDWGDTPSEPLPIADGTLFLLLIAATMITIIAIKQRKQKQLQSITTNNNNNPTQHMTTRKQTYQSFFQKLFLLLAFVCFVGQVSADRTIYFRPSTTQFSAIDDNYANKGCWTYDGGNSEYILLELYQSGWNEIDGTHREYRFVGPKNGTTIWQNTDTRFIKIENVPDNYTGIVAYRWHHSEHGFAIDGINKSIQSSTYMSGKTRYPDRIMHSIPRTDKQGYWPSGSPIQIPSDKNLLVVPEGQMGSTTKQYYWAYYMPANSDVQIYFANTNDWSNVQLLTNKDIYTRSTNLTTIANTRLCYKSFSASTEYAYNRYGFVGNNTIKYEGQVGVEPVGQTISLTTAQNSRIATLRTTYDNYTQVIEEQPLGVDATTGISLFTPGSANQNSTLSKETITTWETLNHTQTVIVETGGKLNYKAAYLTGKNTSTFPDDRDLTGTISFTAAYTGSVILRAKPDDGYYFLGFFDEATGELLTRGEKMTDELGGYVYRYQAPNAPKTIKARFAPHYSRKLVRIHYFNGRSWTLWDTTSSGNSITIKYTDIVTGNPLEYTFDKYITENVSDWVYPIMEYVANSPTGRPCICIENISPNHPVTLTASNNSAEGYVFVGWWYTSSGRPDNPWEIADISDYNDTEQPHFTARFAKVVQHTINVHTYNQEQNKYVLSEEGGNVEIVYKELTPAAIGGTGVQNCTTSVALTNTYTIPSNTSVTLTATPKEGYTFVGWYNENGALVNLGTPTVNTNPNKPEERIFKYTFTANTSQQLTARFRKVANKTFRIQGYDGTKTYYTPADLDKTTSNPNLGTFTAKYYSGESNKEELVTKTINTNAVVGDAEILYGTEMILEATPTEGYDFIGWYNNRQDGWVCTDATWTSLTDTTQADITARFAKRIAIKPQIQTSWDKGTSYDKNAAGGSVNIKYYDGKVAPQSWAQGETYTNNSQNSETNISAANNEQPIKALKNSDIILEANTNSGYEFMGWYTSTGDMLMSSDPIYTLNTPNSQTVIARFKATKSKLTVSVLNFDTKYNDFVEYEYEYNTITLTGGGKTLESYSSFSCEFDGPTSVTLTATPEPDEETGYDFIGWYQNNTLLSDQLTLNVNVIGLQAISAHFAPKKCWELTIKPNVGGLYTLFFSRDQNFENARSAKSTLKQDTYTHFPFGTTYVKVSPQPIIGYKYLGFKVGSYYSQSNVVTYPRTTGNKAETNIITDFVREDDQIVYLYLKGADNQLKWTNSAPTVEYYAYAYNDFRPTQELYAWIPMEPVEGVEGCYRCTIPGNIYNRVDFVQLCKDAQGKFITTNQAELPTGFKLANYTLVEIRDTYKLQYKRTEYQTIPATRYNCFRIQGEYTSDTGNGQSGYINGWTTPPTQVGDFRLVYIEQTVVDKHTIREDYRFDKAEAIKKRTDKEGTDILSLHIYNKVSEDGTIDGMNNPEVILQRCTGFVDGKSQWEDVERRMVFGPLRATDEGVIRMPSRRNASTTTVVYDNGIDNIKNNDQDNGSGVWNFVIKQDGNGNATILAEQTLRYTGDYYIRTTNADGQYNNYTHPGNIMTYSKYAADHRNHTGYTDYFIRYVDINEDGKATAEAGKHPLVKFAIANDYAIYLNHELMIDNDRFADDEYGVDKFVVDKGGAPNLTEDASVRFGWDRVTNRLTRAYIANTTTKNNEYLVIEGEEGNNKIGSPSGDAAYFTDNSNWLYSIDLPNAKAGATAKVKAKMNGQYQYFMGSGSQDGYETLISGNGANTYPIRLLYDFKDDRFTTIYRPSNTDIGSNITLETPVMIERKHNEAPTQIQFNHGASINVTTQSFDQPAYAVMTFLEEKLASKDITHHEKMFYWISFPFDVKISDIFGLGKYGKYWIMQRYDGAQRAASGLAQNNWKYITNTGYTLEKNVGYVICLNYNGILQDQLFKSYGGSASQLNNGKLSLYFPSKDVINPKDISLQTVPVVVELEAWEAGENIAWNHLNWHIIGVPSFADPTFSTTQGDVPFFYQYWHPTDGYAAVASTKVDFYAMHSYMVQYAGKIKWSKIVNTAPQSLAARRDAAAEERVMLCLELQQAGSTLDRTYVQLRSDKGTLGFDLNLDLSKIINAGSNIYSVVSGDQMAGNAIPKDEAVLPIGVVTSAAGEYSFAMPEGTEGMIVELIDYEQGTSMNLLMSDYTVTLPKGTLDQRFALRLKPDKVATSVDNIGDGNTSGETVRKLLIDGMLYMQRGNITYDAQGRIVFER